MYYSIERTYFREEDTIGFAQLRSRLQPFRPRVCPCRKGERGKGEEKGEGERIRDHEREARWERGEERERDERERLKGG